MAQNAHVKPAAISMAILWGAVVVSAVSHVGPGRLHGTLLAGAACASMWLIAAFGLEYLRETVYRFDRGYEMATRAVRDGWLDENQG